MLPVPLSASVTAEIIVVEELATAVNLKAISLIAAVLPFARLNKDVPLVSKTSMDAPRPDPIPSIEAVDGPQPDCVMPANV